MTKVRYGPLLILLLAGALMLGAGAWFVPSEQDSTATPAPTSESTPRVQTTPAPTSASTPQAGATPAVEVGSSIEGVASGVVTEVRNLSGQEALRILIWLVVIVLGVVFGGRLVHALLRRLARRTATTFDDALLDVIGPQIRWFIAAIGFNLATLQLEFLTSFGQNVLRFTSFLLYWFVALHNVLTEAGIELPCPSQSPNVQADDQTLAEGRS